MEKKKVGHFQRTSEEEGQRKSIPSISPSKPSSEYAEKREKVTFYLSAEQVDKLEELIYLHLKVNGKRIKRNDIIRYLIDQCSIEWLKDL